MSQDWFRLSLEDGALEKIMKAPSASKPVHWVERDLENLLALNPVFLGVADDFPLRLQGVRGTVTSPDQAFVDELGRVVVVEVKKVRAQLAVIAQVIAYSNHWHMLPPAEIDRGLLAIAKEEGRLCKYGLTLAELQIWAGDQSRRIDDLDGVKLLGKKVLKRLDPAWAREPWTQTRVFGPEHRRSGDAACIGAASRMITVAPSFSDDCIEFAEKLTERMVGVELVEVEVVRARDEIFVGRHWTHRSEVSEPTWQLLRDAWKLQSIRDNFVINGFADQLSTESFSLSVRAATEARLWIWATETKGSITTVVPDGWHRSDLKRRRQLREELMEALPEGFDPSERWLVWDFELPTKRTEMLGVLDGVARAICSVLKTPVDASYRMADVCGVT